MIRQLTSGEFSDAYQNELSLRNSQRNYSKETD
jgi:hypothetical protein